MKRPLFLAALFLVIISTVRLLAGWAGEAPPGRFSMKGLEASETLMAMGQVYQKDETSIYLKSVIISESDALGQIQCQENLICEIGDARNVPLGCDVAVRGDFYPCSPATNPGEFDAAVYYRTLGIGGRLRKGQLLAVGESHWPLREALYSLKCFFKERLYHIFPQKEAAVMSALLLGDKKELDSELKELYKRNGILHILSISSLHITIIGMSVYRLLRRIGLPIWLSAAGGSILLILYGGMTGFSISACRAIGMYLIKMLGEIVGRTYDMLTALGVMGAGMVALNPYYLQNSGFLLSFGSVLGIGVVYPALAPESSAGALREAGGSRKGLVQLRPLCAQLLGTLLQSFAASLSITLATLPVQLWFYYEIPVYSVFLNLFVLPFMKPMMITGLTALLVPGLGILGIVDYCILKSYEILCACFDRLPFRTWNPGCPQIWQVALYYLLLSAAVIMRNRRKKVDKMQESKAPQKTWADGIGDKAASGRLRGHRIAWICCTVSAVILLGLRPAAANSVTFLDVGQGDCILVRTASGENYLFDCGSSSRSGIGKYVLIPYLKYHGIGNIDAIFLSHPDADHVNGAVELLGTGKEEHIRVGQLLLPAIREEERQEQLGELLAAADAAQEGPVPVGYLQAGDSWSCGSAVFTCLHPNEGIGTQDVNAYSECFLVEFSEGRASGGKRWTMLLTGDVQNEGEEALQEEILARGIRGITVLKAAHHGSKNSTPGRLLEQLSPMVTVISSGRGNRYGHPHAELLERLEDIGTVVAQTADSGAITVTLQGRAVKLSSFMEREEIGK